MSDDEHVCMPREAWERWNCEAPAFAAADAHEAMMQAQLADVVPFDAVLPLLRDARRIMPDVYAAWRKVEPGALTPEQRNRVEDES